jgi:hypothetical protein
MKVRNETGRTVFVSASGAGKRGHAIAPGAEADVPDDEAVQSMVKNGVLAKVSAPKQDENGGEGT